MGWRKRWTDLILHLREPKLFYPWFGSMFTEEGSAEMYVRGFEEYKKKNGIRHVSQKDIFDFMYHGLKTDNAGRDDPSA